MIGVVFNCLIPCPGMMRAVGILAWCVFFVFFFLKKMVGTMGSGLVGCISKMSLRANCLLFLGIR